MGQVHRLIVIISLFDLFQQHRCPHYEMYNILKFKKKKLKNRLCNFRNVIVSFNVFTFTC